MAPNLLAKTCVGWRPLVISICIFTTLVVVIVQRPPQCPAGGDCTDTEPGIHASIAAAKSPRLTKLREIRDSHSFEALVYQPPGDGPFPLLLYFHGAGEQGGTLQDILSEGATGTPPVALATGQALPALSKQFVVVAPHTDHGWSGDEISTFTSFLLSSKSGLRLDPTRLYATGHSMGGYGALAAAATGKFAAAVPVAGAGSPNPSRLRGIPVWAFHGKNDIVVPSAVSEELIDSLQRMGASKDNARITLYDDAPAPPGWPDYYGHASTIPAYATEELYTWLLARHL